MLAIGLDTVPRKSKSPCGKECESIATVVSERVSAKTICNYLYREEDHSLKERRDKNSIC